MVFVERRSKIAVEVGDEIGEGGTSRNVVNGFQSLGWYPKGVEYHEKRMKI